MLRKAPRAALQRVVITLFAVVASQSVVAEAAEGDRVRYDGHWVVEAQPRSLDELELWLELSEDVWSEHVSTMSVVLRVEPENLAALQHSDLRYRVIHNDLQWALDVESNRVSRARSLRNMVPWTYGLNDYLDLDEYRAVVDGWVADAPGLTSLEIIGTSVEGRPLRALHISGQGGDAKPVLMLLSGHHAREWLAHHATMCAVDRLVQGYGVDDVVTHWLDRVEVIFVPMANPDGYRHTWTVDRLWRKNRGAGGQGVDLNRNWDVAWGTASSSSPRSDAYHGPSPFSEPETRALSDLVLAHADRLEGFVDIHAFGSLVLYPYGYTREDVENVAEYAKVAAAMSVATNDAYSPINISDFVGAASGSSADWVHDNIDEGLAFGIEVRGQTFTEPASQIGPTCDEVYPALLALLDTFEVENPEPPPGDTTGHGSGGSAAVTTTTGGTPPLGTAGEEESTSASEATTGEAESGSVDTSSASPPSQDSMQAGCACNAAEPSNSSVLWWLIALAGLVIRRKPMSRTTGSVEGRVPYERVSCCVAADLSRR